MNSQVIKEDMKKARDIMSHRVVWIRPDYTVDAGIQIMEKYKIGGLVVVNEGRLVGVVTFTDLHSRHPNQQIQDVMSKKVVTILPETTVHEMYDLMKRHNIGRLPVIDEDNYVIGIVTKGDLLTEFNSFAIPDAVIGESGNTSTTIKVDSEAASEKKSETRNWKEVYKRAYSFIENIISAIKEGKEFTIDDGFGIITHIINNQEAIDALCLRATYTENSLDALVSHPVNVTIHALKIGIGLKYQRRQLVDLGMAALLHDLGMARIPKEIIEKEEKLTDKEIEVLQKHPKYGKELLLTLGEDFAWLAEIILQEHEREGGLGYPRGLKGYDIHEYAKIIGLVDVYEALTHLRPYRKPFLPHEAVKEIMGSQRKSFSSKIVKTLIKQLSVFPIQSYVRLNSHAIGRVIGSSEAHLLRPTIQVLYDSQGRKPANKRIIKLHEEPLLYIIDSIHEKDLPL